MDAANRDSCNKPVMARFSFPVVQVGAALGAVAMVLIGQQLGARSQTAVSVMDAPAAVAGQARPSDAAPRRPNRLAHPRAATGRAQDPAAPASGAFGLRDRASASNGDAGPNQALAPQPRLAVIIDDVGHDLQLARALIALEAPVTLSILPYAEAAPQIAAEARAAGREVFVHLPMEPVGLDDPGPGAITAALTPREIALRVQAALARVPGASGLNNHMGSRVTRNAEAMAAVFAPLRSADLIFVDSLTHPGSIAGEAALAAGLASFDRDVFLDNPEDDPAAQLDLAITRALEAGQAVAIGHPRPATLVALAALQAKADAAGVSVVSVSALVDRDAPPS